MLNILQFGAVGDGVTMNTAAFEEAVGRAQQTGETVMVPSGVFLTGTIVLDGVSMHLEAGAVIKASGNLLDYPPQPYVHNELGVLRALIVNLSHDNVVIDGSGTIDFSGSAFYAMDEYNVPDSKVPFTPAQVLECTHPIGERPAQCLFFHDSKNVTVCGIRLVDAPCWTLTFSECENVKIQGLTIDTDLNIPNDDGIHLSACKGVIISDCRISSGDDCIAVTSITNWEKPCEDVVITNCVLRTCSKAIAIGYMYSIVRNVLVSNTIIKESNRGLCFMCNDEAGLIENVRITNMHIETRIRAGNWWGNGEPILLMVNRQDYHIPPEQKPAHRADCSIRNLVIDGATCIAENAIGIVGEQIEDVELRNIDFTRKPSDNIALKGDTFDLAPGRNTVEVPEDCGVYVSGAKGVILENLRMHRWKVIQE